MQQSRVYMVQMTSQAIKQTTASLHDDNASNHIHLVGNKHESTTSHASHGTSQWLL